MPNILSPVASQTSTADADDGSKVNETAIAYDRMALRWELLHALQGGTTAMREASTTWLPREPQESGEAYLIRLNRSILYNAFNDTVEKLGSKPFSRAVTLQGKVSDAILEIEADVDRSGTNLTQFCASVFDAGLTYGLTHILVDFTKLEENSDEDAQEDDAESSERNALTLADERAQGARAMLLHVKAPSLIGWRSTKIAGKDVLDEIRIHEVRVEPLGDYGEQEVEYVRVYSRTSWELWRRDPKGEMKWFKDSSGNHTFGAVPLVTIYFKKTGFLEGLPPLEDLAWLNLAHWQSYSDQRNILRFARTAILFARGLTEEDMEKNVTLGPNRIFRTTSEVADMKYVEHTGKSIGAGENDLRNLENRMEVLGLQPLIQRSGGETATGRAIDEGKSQSMIQAWIRAEENGVVMALEMAMRWTDPKFKHKDDFGVDIFNEFGLSLRAQEDIKSLIDMRKTGIITQETFLKEVIRRGVLSDTVDVEAEAEQVSIERSALFGPDDDDDEEDNNIPEDE